MVSYDWIVVGNGLAGAALSYELQRQGLSVLVLEQFSHPCNATRYSYGGIAYWSGTTDLTRQLCQEGIELHRHLSDELDAETQFRELDLLLTIAADRDPNQVAATYSQFATLPQLLDVAAANELEPLLNPAAISGALHLPHGHVSPEATVQAYNQAFLRLGGQIQIASVTGWVRQFDRIQGVRTSEQTYSAANTIVCAGAISRSLLRSIGRSIRLYFTQAEIVETPPLHINLRTLIMPAELKRFAMEAKAGSAATDALWDEAGHELEPGILDAGAIQFMDERIRIGQMSRALTTLEPPVDAAASEAQLRQTISQILPILQAVPGQWRRCQVGFSSDRLPLIGAIPELEGLHLFTGFSNPFAMLPPLARRFAQTAIGTIDPLLAQLTPSRFD